MHLAVATLLTASLIGQPPDLPPFARDHAKTMTYYYKSPDPALGPKLLKDLLKKENVEHPWFAKNDHVLNLITSQLGDIAAGKPKIVRAYEAAWTDASAPGRRLIVRALMNCGDRETLKLLDTWVTDRRNA